MVALGYFGGLTCWAPVAWKQALVVLLYKGKGSQQSTDNYQWINLLSILGKVYTMLFMHRVSQVVGANLHKVQCGFCSS